MSLCDIFPDDPSCAQPTPEPEPVPADVDEVTDEELNKEDPEISDDEIEPGSKIEEEDSQDSGKTDGEKKEMDYSSLAQAAAKEWSHIKALSSLAGLSPTMDQLKFFMVAAGWAGSAALTAFRYRSESTYYDSGKIGDDTNWWKLGDQIRNYGGLSVGGVLAVTSLLATFGIANSVNVMAWEFLGLGSALLGLAIFAIRFLGYDAAYKHSTGTDAAKSLSGKAVMEAIREDGIFDAVMEVSSFVTLASAKEGVAYKLWNSLQDSEQAEKISEWEQAVEEKAAKYQEQKEASDSSDKEKSEKSDREDDEEKL